MNFINLMGWPYAYSKALGFGKSDTETKTAYESDPRPHYECSKHHWSGEIAYYFSCPSCELKSYKSCQFCTNTFRFNNLEFLLTRHSSTEKPTIADYNKIIRKYSKSQNKVIYFCSGGCYQAYEKNKTSCIIC